MRALLTSIAFLALPLLTHAASFRELVDDLIVPFVDRAVMPLLYALAFLFFLMGLVRYFFSHEAEARQQGKQFALWGIIGIVVMFAVWGIVRLFLSVLGV